MGVGYQLVNQSKQEIISFAHLPVNTQQEIVGNPVASALVVWYLFKNPGCDIHFVSDTYTSINLSICKSGFPYLRRYMNSATSAT